VGQGVYRHAQTMLAEAQAAREVVDRLSAQPRGVVRVSVPVSLAQQEIPALLPDFLALYPEVRVQLLVSNRRFDLINEGVDVALRVRTKLEDDGSLVMRTFGPIQSLVVASPKYLDGMGRPKTPADLADHVTLNMSEEDHSQRWHLHGPGGVVETVELRPRVTGFDFPLLRSLARRGVGITLLPENLCAELVHRGELEVVLPEWRLPEGICHAVFASRRGLLPAVRVFIDFLAERLPPLLEAARLDCRENRKARAAK
jgi:DNA-binding transcriptional LysR family regulator